VANLPELLNNTPPDIEQIAEYFDDLLILAVKAVNSEFGPKRLSKGTREIEPLPTDPRQLSSYRTRIGTMLEYAISTGINNILEDRYGNQYSLTFATSNEYPDFYLRDYSLVSLIKMEMKSVDAESDEQAARFSTPTAWINPERDLLLLITWEWTGIRDNSGNLIGEYPHIYASLVIPAGEVAKERDIRLLLTGGKIEDLVVSVKKRDGIYGSDPGNYGKFWRIIHNTRRNSTELSSAMKKFQIFLEVVNEHSPRKRFTKKLIDQDKSEL
jgi:hypothetical protein